MTNPTLPGGVAETGKAAHAQPAEDDGNLLMGGDRSEAEDTFQLDEELAVKAPNLSRKLSVPKM